MTRDEAQVTFDQKIASLTVEAAIECYTLLRQSHLKKSTRDITQAMIMTGNSLEKIIGEDIFEALMDTIDAPYYGTGVAQ
jgi:hypothetical protein|tara:strand:+ start:387 stop:626 length:240 start_codon:yes stop_codon:yes gene_type:complete